MASHARGAVLGWRLQVPDVQNKTTITEATEDLTKRYHLEGLGHFGINEADGVIHFYFTRKTYLKTLPETWLGWRINWHSAVGKVRPL